MHIAALWVTLTVLMALQKVIFMLAVSGYALTDVWLAMAHGLPMDMSVSAYLSALPAVAMIATPWWQPRWLSRVAKPYYAFISLVMALGCVANCALYPYWGFPLDTTPIFYITTSPTAAAASKPWWVWSLGLLATIALAAAYYLAICAVLRRCRIKPIKGLSAKAWATVAQTLLAGLLFIALRGGVTVSTMSPGTAYFSSNMRLNHAAVNPMFSFLYSATHQTNFDKEFQYFPIEQAQAYFAEMNSPLDSVASHEPRIEGKPNIVLVVLEGFSTHIMPSMGGKPLAMRLDSIAQEGVMFTNFYANSFRTDRALPAILCNYPAQPTTSLLLFPSKVDSLPSIAAQLGELGYESTYYYGGDLDYCNFNALLAAGKYDHMVGEQQFPLSERLSKWGAHDEHVYKRALADLKKGKAKPQLAVIQTSSSHEPYEVPYKSRFADNTENAFAYADSCLGAFYDELKRMPQWDNTLVVIAADHFGEYTAEVDDPIARHHSPLVLAGGALDKAEIDSTLLSRPASQEDIAPTLLGLAGAKHDNMRFGHNLLDPSRRARAYLSEPGWIALVTEDGKAMLSTDTNEPMIESDTTAMNWLKAYIQTLYLDLNAR